MRLPSGPQTGRFFQHCGLRIWDCGFNVRDLNPESAIRNRKSEIGRTTPSAEAAVYPADADLRSTRESSAVYSSFCDSATA